MLSVIKKLEKAYCVSVSLQTQPPGPSNGETHITLEDTLLQAIASSNLESYQPYESETSAIEVEEDGSPGIVT